MAREGFQEAIDLGGGRAGGEGLGDLRRHLVGAEPGEKGLAAGFGPGRQGEGGGGEKQFDSLMQTSQVAKALGLGGQECGSILPALAAVERNRALACAGAIIGDAAGKPLVFQSVVDGAAMMGEMRAGQARGLVDGESRARVEGQRDAAERGAGGAIRGQVGRRLRAQPRASSKALRNRVASSERGAWELPKRTLSPPNLPTEWIGTPALPAASISASA